MLEISKLKKNLSKILYNNKPIRVLFKNHLSSTNDYFKYKYVKDQCPIIIITNNQRASRGRNNKIWYSFNQKSLSFSLCLKLNANQTELGKLNYLSCLAALRAFKDTTNHALSIKWPNDILVNSKKISGILCELDYQADSENFIIVGIGINVNFESNDFMDNSEIKYNIEPTSMNLILNKTLNIDDVLEKILKNFATSFKSKRSDLISYYKKNWFDREKNIEVLLGNNLIKGTAIDIKENGSLILRTKSETKEIMSGEIISS